MKTGTRDQFAGACSVFGTLAPRLLLIALSGFLRRHQLAEQRFDLLDVVGSLDDGKTFFAVGTRMEMSILFPTGRLLLYYWDSNKRSIEKIKSVLRENSIVAAKWVAETIGI